MKRLRDNKEWHGPLRTIQERVCKEFGISMIDINSARRDRKSVIPRHIAMWLCRSITCSSLPMIGIVFGNRDHTTVASGCRRALHWMEKDPVLSEKANKIAEEFLNGF